MDLLQIFVLAVVQGITEFLPISSSAHLILVPELTPWADQGVVFDVALHVGTLFAVLLYFRKETVMALNGKLNLLKLNYKTPNARLVINLAISTIPLIVFGFVMKDFVANAGRSMAVLATTSIVFGLLLYLCDKKSCTENTDINLINSKQALLFGLFQAIAIIPGTSRSGICMTAGRVLGYDRETASRYAMLMAIPVIFLLGAYTMLSGMDSAINWRDNTNELLWGIVLSFVSALAAIHLLMTFINRIGFTPFVIYRVLLGVFLWIYVLEIL